jgi:NAD(P)-dependent dehydrogenase (short-subunit alcohol dehydrogenase family)
MGPSYSGSVVITGASTGIGEACALHLDQLGMRVFAGVRRDADGDRLRQQASERLTPVQLDVTDEGSIAAAARMVDSEMGGRGLDGLVNNAGIAIAGPLEFVPIDELRRQLEVNVIGQVAVTQAFLPLLRRARGRVVNIGSVSGKLATPFVAPYAASKFAMEAITDALRFELQPWGIDVSIIEPGSVATPIWQKSEDIARDMEARLPGTARALYGEQIDRLYEFGRETGARGIPPIKVAEAVAHAIRAKRPRTRYVVGMDARVQAALAGVAPDRVRDRLINVQLKLPREAPGAEVDAEMATAGTAYSA